jgi:hypothetical protein
MGLSCSSPPTVMLEMSWPRLPYLLLCLHRSLLLVKWIFPCLALRIAVDRNVCFSKCLQSLQTVLIPEIKYFLLVSFSDFFFLSFQSVLCIVAGPFVQIGILAVLS